jgi:hypothetical protein
MGMVMGVTAVVVGFAAALAGLIIWTALIFPNPAARARAALETRPGRCLLLGIFLAAILGIPFLALWRSPHGQGKIAGWVVAFPLLSMLVIGLTAMAQLLGGRLRPLSPAMTPLGALVRGAITVELAAFLPFFGWFLFTPLMALTVIGAGAIGVLGRRGKASEYGTFPTETGRGDEGDEKNVPGRQSVQPLPPIHSLQPPSALSERESEPAGAVWGRARDVDTA